MHVFDCIVLCFVCLAGGSDETVPNWPANEKRFCCMLVATVAISRI